MKIKIKTVILGIVVLSAGCGTYFLLWGELFTVSPIILGFSKYELSNIIAYVQNGAEGGDLPAIDTFIPAVERFHDLEFIKKPRLFFFRDRASYLRRSLTRARFNALPNGRLVISPWAVQEAKEGIISLEIYLRHELSHTLLYQHMSLPMAFRYPQWLMEGIAVYSSGQMGTSWYPSKDETYAYMRQGNFMPPQLFKTRKEDRVRLDVPYRMTFMYAEFACIVDRLISIRGRERFMMYMKRLLKDSHHDAVFREIYGLDFEGFLLGFRAFVENNPVTAGRWP